ncbi:MAG: hypothetical protein ACREAA_03515 [Candidatus Polarisedimenticolia bacterium]
MMSESERRFLVKLNALHPGAAGAAGYGDEASRTSTEARLRDGLVEEMARLRAKIDELMRAAEEEGEEDMRDDLGRIGERMERTADALAGGEATAFAGRGEVSPADRELVSGYDLQLLEDMELLQRDVMGMKYETIGTLTLREVEGTLAAIELKVVNRKDVLETSGGS